jgi:hypothetical protein
VMQIMRQAGRWAGRQTGYEEENILVLWCGIGMVIPYNLYNLYRMRARGEGNGMECSTASMIRLHTYCRW